jgi:hypothetical protein
MGTHYILPALCDVVSQCHCFFAASSEAFGRMSEVPQNENTIFHPRSACGISKVAGYELTGNYREAYNLDASSGILYNDESPDYAIATGEMHSVREFADAVFRTWARIIPSMWSLVPHSFVRLKSISYRGMLRWPKRSSDGTIPSPFSSSSYEMVDREINGLVSITEEITSAKSKMRIV